MTMKDFTRARKKVQFLIDADTFTGVDALPAEVMMDFTLRFEAMDEESPADGINALKDVLDTVLLDDSAARFRERMGSKTDPIELPQVNDVVMWLLEQYGMRPTEQPSNSVVGLPSQVSGMSLTGTTPAVESTSSLSPLTGS